MHKIDDVVKNEGGGGRRQIMRGYPATPIDHIYIKLVDRMLLSLHVDYNLGLFNYTHDGTSKNKNYIVYMYVLQWPP